MGKFQIYSGKNNKDRLNGTSLSDAEFEQVKNQLQFSSFYKAGEWLVGENGKVMVHVQRDTEKLHFVVMNHEHIAGGSGLRLRCRSSSALSHCSFEMMASCVSGMINIFSAAWGMRFLSL